MDVADQSGEASPELVPAALARVLASPEFSASPRLRRFLSHVVENALAARPGELKEYNIALAVFDRDPSFDPATNTIVRVEARRLRQLLAAYYAGSGCLDPIVLVIPKGGYAPAYRQRTLIGDSVANGSTGRAQIRGWQALAGLAVMAGVGLSLAYGTGVLPGVRVPHSWKLDGANLSVFDERDRLCWEKRFGAFDQHFERMVIDKVLIADIDNDRQVEVLFNQLPDRAGVAGGSLLCFDQSGSLRWEFHYGAEKTFGNRSFDAAYRGRLLRPVTVHGKPLLLTVANHYLWYPAQVALLDPASGRVLEQYWHPGSIYAGVVQDVDGDGSSEFVFGAINNPGDGLGHAAVGILRIPFSAVVKNSGSANDSFPPVTGGGEQAYALLPLPDVSRVMGQLPVFSNFKVEHGRIIAETPLPESGGIVYSLDFELNVREYRLSDNLPSVHQRLFRQKLLGHVLSAAESASLGKSVTFSAAPDGNSPKLKQFWPF